MHFEVGAYEAKTKLSELLRRVQAGDHFTITHRGQKIAEIIPFRKPEEAAAMQAVKNMLAFMNQSPTVPGLDLKAMIEEGRA